MAEAIDLERMMVSLEAETTKLERDFSKAVSIVNTFSDKMERRTDQLKSKIELQFSQAGSNAARRLTGALAAGLSFAAIEQFISHIGETTETIEKQSRALGLTTDAYQALGLSAKHASIDQDSFDSAMDFFSKNVGLAQLKTTDFGKIMKKLGVDIHAGPEQAFFQFVDALNKVGNVQQRNAVLTLAMGRSSVQMAALLGQGSAALKTQADQFKANGEIIDREAIEKINKLRVVWGDFKSQLTVAGTNVLSGLTDQLSKFEGGIESPQFQSALKNVGVQLANVAHWMLEISNSPWFKYIAAGAVGFKVGGLSGAALAVGGTAAYANRPSLTPPTDVAEARKALSDAQKALDDARAGKVGLESYLPKTVRSIIDSINPISDPTIENALRARDSARKDLQAAQRAAAKVKPAPAAVAPAAGTTDLSGFLEKAPKGAAAAKTSEYAKAVADLVTKTKTLAQAEDDSTEATARADAKTRLLDAARQDGVKITDATINGTDRLGREINSLASAYAAVTAARAFDKDLATEDQRIAKLREEAKQADLSAAAIAELEEREKLLADFHDKFGKNAVPTPAQQTEIDARAAQLGQGTGDSAFAKNVKAAQDENKALQDQISTIGLYGGALAEAQMRMTLFNQVMEAKGKIEAEDLARINALAAAHGALTQQLEDQQEEEAKRVAVTDELRTGLENIGVTGVTAFKDLKSAAGEFLQQLAQLIVKLYVMQPLLDSLLGKQGTSGGGILGSLLGSLLGSGSGSAGGLQTPGGFMDFTDIPLTFATGGKISGPGGPREDRIPIMASDGEYVVNADSTTKHGALLKAINDGDETHVREIAAHYVGQRIAYDLGALAPFLTDLPKVRPRKFADGGRVPRLQSLPRFADGGMIAGGAASVSVSHDFPSMVTPKVQPSTVSHAATVVFSPNIDARGATEGTAAMIHKTFLGYLPAIKDMVDRQNKATFPDNARRFFRDVA